MPLRDFTDQQTAATGVHGDRDLRWLELDCPRCGMRSYVSARNKRLARVGSQREYSNCAWCGQKLTLGRLKVYPNGKGFWSRFAFWREIRGGATMESE